MAITRTHAVQRRTAPAGRWKRESLGALIGGGVIAMVVGWYLVFGAPPVPPYRDGTTGSIVIWSTRRPDCQRLEFNNDNGNIKNLGRGDCPNGNGSQTSRVGEISTSFWHR